MNTKLTVVAMIPIDCKITNFPLHLLSNTVLLGVCLQAMTSKEFRNAVMSCLHTWQCDIWMSLCQVCIQLIIAFQKSI